MNIIDAIKSGLPFRRVAWDISEWWIQPKAVNYLPRLRSVDILADDWEVEEVKKSVTITREKFDSAWLIVSAADAISRISKFSRDALAEELGL